MWYFEEEMQAVQVRHAERKPEKPFLYSRVCDPEQLAQ